jgi:beta-fructofuranosidase
MGASLAQANAVFSQAQQIRRSFANDPHRPCYHFLPPANWMNDPNGLIHWQGQYHMFYQYNPAGAFWGDIHWGHAVSDDLVHWRDLPIALAPDADGPDRDGCYSGCAVDHDGTPTLIYTGVHGKDELPCLAVSHDGMRTWQKHPANPLVPAKPAGADLLEFRDHCIWREDQAWYMIIGSGIRDVGGAALLFRSTDLRDWAYLHPLCVGDIHSREPVWSAIVWECPQLLALPGGHALVASAWDNGTLYTIYMTGEYRDLHFNATGLHKADYGDNLFYAPQSLYDAGGRCLMWGWLQEGRSREAQIAAGWSGVMSLPRVVTLLPDGRLGFAPAPELEQLRAEHQQFTSVLVADGARNHCPTLQGDALEIAATFAPASGRSGVRVRCAPDDSEETLIGYDWRSGELFMDRTRSSGDPAAQGDRRGGPLELAPGEALQLRIFVDRSAIEVFANGRACLTGRVYPARADSVGVDVFAYAGGATLESLDVWTMRSIWE